MKKISLLLTTAILLTGIYSCKKETEVISPEPITDPVNSTDSTAVSSKGSNAINNWAYNLMKDAYFWSSDMPALNSLNVAEEPSSFFEKLIYNRSTIDRFSTITANYTSLQNSFNGVSKIFGIRYTIAYLDASQASLGLYLSQVVPGSPAELAGMKRGQIITAIDGQQITESNFSSLFTGDTHKFTISELVNDAITPTAELTATRRVVEENPVALTKIVNLPNTGKKLGYVLYSQFIPGSEADAQAYDNQLRQAFADFKAAGISELVLDLRSNGGGYISSAETLASLIGKNVNSSKIFYVEQWNSTYTEYYTKQYGGAYFNHGFRNEPNALGGALDRVFVLTSNATASASELVINGLKPYMEVITIGEHTYGKNLFGTLMQDNVNNSGYGVYVMLGQTANSLKQSDYGDVNGIDPTYVVEDNVIPYRPYADENETLFSKVLEVIGEKNGTVARVKPGKKIVRTSNYIYHETEELPLGVMIKDKL